MEEKKLLHYLSWGKEGFFLWSAMSLILLFSIPQLILITGFAAGVCYTCWHLEKKIKKENMNDKKDVNLWYTLGIGKTFSLQFEKSSLSLCDKFRVCKAVFLGKIMEFHVKGEIKQVKQIISKSPRGRNKA